MKYSALVLTLVGVLVTGRISAEPDPQPSETLVQELDALIEATSVEVPGETPATEPILLAQNRNTRTRTRTRVAAPVARPVARPQQVPVALSSRRTDPRLVKARTLATTGQYQEAAKLLFQLSRNPEFDREAPQIKYILGLMLFELKMYQSAAFVYYDVIRQEAKISTKSRFFKQALEKLSIAADLLESDVLLRYAIGQIDEEEFPPANRDMLYFRTGEIRLQEKNYAEAARFLGRVKPSSLFSTKAKYLQGLAFAENKEPQKAYQVFDALEQEYSSAGVTDTNRVNAQLAKARVLYQSRNWDAALDAYRAVPRDTEQWHEAYFESAWGMLMSARFRSALSNFHSLHSPYYDDFYQPESLLLRGIVYLYICRYAEMEKVLELFERIYKPVFRLMQNTVTSVVDPTVYYREIVKIESNFDTLRAQRIKRRGLIIPFLVARQILKEGDVRRSFSYLEKLVAEKETINGLGTGWTNSGIGVYGRKIVDRRIEATQILIGKQVRRHMILLLNELRDLFEQNGFLRFEMISGRKEVVKKELAGKGLERAQVSDSKERDYFVQNGYEYYPFKGEYWLDEIGNYHFVGVQACQ